MYAVVVGAEKGTANMKPHLKMRVPYFPSHPLLVPRVLCCNGIPYTPSSKPPSYSTLSSYPLHNPNASSAHSYRLSLFPAQCARFRPLLTRAYAY